MMKNCKLKREITLTVKNQKKTHFLHRMDKLKAILVKVSHDSPKKASYCLGNQQTENYNNKGVY